MHRRTVRRPQRLAWIASFLIVLLLASCGGAAPTAPAAESGAVDASAASAAGTAASESAAQQPAADTGDAVTLRIMHWNESMVEETAWWKDVLDGFVAQHPNVTIENNYVPFAQYLPTLEAQAAGDSLPDVFFAHVKAAELGRAGLTVDFKEHFDDAFMQQFFPSPMRQFTFDDDKVYALPWSAQTFGIYVNNAIMEQLGLTPPETWDELIAMAPKIREAGFTPLMWGNQARNVCPDFFLPLITQYGGDVYALDDLTDEGLSWDSEPVVNALKLVQRLAQEKVLADGINGITQQQGEELFYQGKAAMLYDGSWLPPAVETAAPEGFNYSVVKNPAVKQGDRHWTGDGSGEGWAVTAKGPNRDLAIEFLTYAYSSDTYNKVIKASQFVPSMPAAMDQLDNENVRTMTGWIEDGTHHILFGKGNWDAVSNVCQGVLDGTVQPEDGAAQIQSDIEAARAR